MVSILHETKLIRKKLLLCSLWLKEINKYLILLSGCSFNVLFNSYNLFRVYIYFTHSVLIVNNSLCIITFKCKYDNNSVIFSYIYIENVFSYSFYIVLYYTRRQLLNNKILDEQQF